MQLKNDVGKILTPFRIRLKPNAQFTDLFIDPHIAKILVLGTDNAPIQKTTNSQSTQIHIDHLQDQETLDFLDLAHTPILDIKSI